MNLKMEGCHQTNAGTRAHQKKRKKNETKT